MVKTKFAKGDLVCVTFAGTRLFGHVDRRTRTGYRVYLLYTTLIPPRTMIETKPHQVARAAMSFAGPFKFTK